MVPIHKFSYAHAFGVEHSYMWIGVPISEVCPLGQVHKSGHAILCVLIMRSATRFDQLTEYVFMAKIQYDSTYADYVVIKFRCSCGQEIVTGHIPVRSRYDNNINVNSFYHNAPVTCCKCRKEHKIHFYDDMYTASCEISTIDNNDSIIYLHEIPFEYVGDYDTSFVDYVEEIVRMKDLIKTIKKDIKIDQDILYRMVLTYSISIMDAYLGNTFIYHISKYKLFKDQFVVKMKAQKKRVTNVLEEIDRRSFQNLERIAIPFYKYAFDIEIPRNQIIQDAVHIRNSIVHNNGREKDGYKNHITERFIEELIPQIENLVRSVYQQIRDVVFEKIIMKNIDNKQK